MRTGQADSMKMRGRFECATRTVAADLHRQHVRAKGRKQQRKTGIKFSTECSVPIV